MLRLAAATLLIYLLNEVVLIGASQDHHILDDINNHILAGRLPQARRMANECFRHNINRNKGGQGTLCPTNNDILQTYKEYTALFYEKEGFLDILANSMQVETKLNETQSKTLQALGCWDGSLHGSSDALFGIESTLPDANRWNECCSFYNRDDIKQSKCVDPTNKFDRSSNLCCDFSSGTDNYLALPALKEPNITIRLDHPRESRSNNKQDFIYLDQEGQLGLYDVSGVLWPSGYLLGLCLNDPVFCGLPEIINLTQHEDFTMALELGAGVGFPSIAFAKSMNRRLTSSDVDACQNGDVCRARKQSQVVVATDFSRSSLGLITSNSYQNNIENLVHAHEIDHMSFDSVTRLLKRFYPDGDGFDLIFGSSLQGFFDRTSDPDARLWRTLDALLSRSNQNALVLLVHVRSTNEKIILPESRQCDANSFDVVSRISGDVFLMRTRDGNTSDFEIVVLKRRFCE